MTNTTAKRAFAGVFILVAIAMASCASLFLAGVLFLISNKSNPTKARLDSYFIYWNAYKNDDLVKGKLYGSAVAAGALCFIVLPIGLVVAARKKRSLHGDARFATSSEIRNAGLTGSKGILVGKHGSKYLMLDGQQFVILAAPTRSGKGVGVVIPNLLAWTDSVMVMDIKGENFLITSGFRKRCGHQVFAFRPFDESGSTHRYNPFDAVRRHPHFRVGDIQAMSATFYPPPTRDAGDGTAKFFNDKASDLFLGLSLYLMESPELPMTLGELLRQSSGKGKPIKEYIQALITKRASAGTPLSEECTDALDRFLSNSDNTMSGILSTFNAPLLIFADPIVDAATSESDFTFSNVRKSVVSIYLIIPAPKLVVAGTLCNLLFSQLIDLNTRVLPKDDETLKFKCMLLMDELTAMGRVGILAKGVGYIAGYGLRILSIIQSMSQLEGVYGKADAKSFTTNHALQVVYAPKEQSDAEEYSKMLGTFTEKATSRSRSRSLGKAGNTTNGTNESDQRRSLMMPQELRELGNDKEIVIMENCKPILCEKIIYYKDDAFMGRLRPAADVPKHSIDIHIARVQKRSRPASPADVEGGIDLSVLAHSFGELPALSANPEMKEVSAFVDSFFESLSQQEDSKQFVNEISDGSSEYLHPMNVIEGIDSYEDAFDLSILDR